MFQDYHEEHALQAFRKKDLEKNGSISALDFYDIMTTLKGHLLTTFVKENLMTVSSGLVYLDNASSHALCGRNVIWVDRYLYFRLNETKHAFTCALKMQNALKLRYNK